MHLATVRCGTRVCFVIAAVFGGAVGCRQVLGAEEREVAPPDSVVGTPLYTEACMACLETSCGPELDACIDDPTCASTFESVRGCVNPGCWSVAFAEFGGLQGAWPLGEELTNRSLDDCTSSVCTDACRVGQNFDCSGQYAWRGIREAGPFDLDVCLVWSGKAVVGALAKTCGAFGCGEIPELDAKLTDDTGCARFAVPGGEDGWYGSLSIDPQPDTSLDGMLPWDHYRNHPFFHYDKVLDPVATQADAEFIADLFERDFDPERAHLLVQLFDCHMWGAKSGLHEIEVDTADDATYIDRELTPGPEQIWALVGWLPAEAARITVTHEDTHATIAVLEVQPRAGALTYIELLPSTTF